MTTDQSTPTSSLEEAREEVREAVGALIMNPMGVPETQRYVAAVLALEAAARDEVIREVEADTVLDAASKAIHDESAKRVGCPIPWEMHDDGYVQRTKQQVAVMLTAAVRALSQGGEGKA